MDLSSDLRYRRKDTDAHRRIRVEECRRLLLLRTSSFFWENQWHWNDDVGENILVFSSQV